MTKFGFDVSHHQNPKSFRFSRVNTGGGTDVDFMIARASYGKGTADRHFVEWAKQIREAKITFGVYHFYRQIHSVEDQLAVFDKQLEAIGGLHPGDMYPVLDLEENQANNDGLPKAKHFSDSCRRIAEIWKDQYGGCILYYSSFFPEYLKEYKDWIKEWDLHWLADYSVPDGKPRTPYSPKAWNLHQPRNRASSLYPVFNNDGKQEVIDHNFSNPAVDFNKLLIKSEDLSDDHVSDDAKVCEDGTTGRPGGAFPGDEDEIDAARETAFQRLIIALDDVKSCINSLRKLK